MCNSNQSMPNVSVYSTASPVYIAFFRIFNLSKHLRNYCYLDVGRCHDLLVWPPPPTTKNTKTLGVTCSWWFRNPAENPILPTWRNQWISEPSTVPNSIHIWYIYIYIILLIINLHEWLMFMGTYVFFFCIFPLWKGPRRCAFDNWPPSWATWDWLHRRCWDHLWNVWAASLGLIDKGSKSQLHIPHIIHPNTLNAWLYFPTFW